MLAADLPKRLYTCLVLAVAVAIIISAEPEGMPRVQAKTRHPSKKHHVWPCDREEINLVSGEVISPPAKLWPEAQWERKFPRNDDARCSNCREPGNACLCGGNLWDEDVNIVMRPVFIDPPITVPVPTPTSFVSLTNINLVPVTSTKVLVKRFVNPLITSYSNVIFSTITYSTQTADTQGPFMAMLLSLQLLLAIIIL